MTNTNSIQVKWPTPGGKITTDGGLIYTIGNIISDVGGFGILYEGYDTFGNSVAIKILRPAKRKFQDVRMQWEKEVSILDKVRHPHVIFIHDAFICDNLFYIVFERAWGNLFDLIKQVGPMHEATVREIARQLLFALYYVHRDGIVHRDLTVYNILFFKNGQSGQGLYKISDFGISEEFTNSWNSTNPIAHRHFKPPELLKFKYTSLQSDLYHLGIVLYYCLTGQFPYDISLPQTDIDSAILKGVPRQRAEQINTPFGKFISILLRRRDEYRFKTELEAWRYLQTKT